MQAVWDGKVLAESGDTVVVDNYHYFPVAAVKDELLRPSDFTTVCSWKGTASYFDIVVDGKVNARAAFTYAEPKERAQHLRDRIAFWKGVEIR